MDHERLGELFERAIDLAPHELDALLTELSKQDPALHAALVEMLRIDAAAAHFLETPPQLVAERIAAESPMPHAFGVWRVLRSLGIGGMGEVWLAERGDGEFEQKVAVKQVAYPTPGLLQRFRQERQILAHLQHPSIARLIDGGVDDAGAPYLVMEYVDGVPITEYVRRHALDVRATLRLFLLACDAVQHAHENLVVHRDLKPSNILVTADGSPKLLDFGIAKVLATTTDEAAPARTMTRMLTPDYAAPEQFSGAPVTTATDVYALGVMLYELLARKRPMRGRAADGTAVAEPAAPSVALDRADSDAGSRRRALRGDLDRIVLAALATDPKRRYSSPAMLSADLRRWLDGQPISARGQAVGYRLRKFIARNRYAVGAAAAVVVVSLVAAMVSLHQAHLAREQAARAEAVRQFLVGVFRQANPDENKGQPITAHGLLDKGVAESRKIAGKEPFLDADVTALLGELYIDINDFARANELLAKLRDDAAMARLPADVRARVLIEVSVIEDENHEFEAAIGHARASLALLLASARGSAEAIAYARYNLAHSLIAHGDYVEAETMLRRALSSGADAPSSGEGFAGEWEQWGVALGKLGRLPEARAALDKSIALNAAEYGENSQHAANALNDLGNACEFNGDLSCAEAAFRRSMEAVRNVLGPDHLDVIVYESNLLTIVEREGRVSEAMPQRLRLIERERRIASVPPLSLANAIFALGKDYVDLGRFDAAETTLREALQLVQSSQGPRSARSTPILRNIGILLSLQGRYDEAESTLRDAIAIEGAHDPPSAPPMNLLHADIGNVLRLRHRVADAIKELETANRGYAENVAGVDFRWAQALAQLGEARLDAGDAVAAEASAAKALEMARKALPADNYQISNELFALGRAKLALGRAGEAEPLLREALALRSPLQPADDPRLLEVDVALVAALNALGRPDEANELAGRIEPLLAASASPYTLDLRARLAERSG